LDYFFTSIFFAGFSFLDKYIGIILFFLKVVFAILLPCCELRQKKQLKVQVFEFGFSFASWVGDVLGM
jgi:hypothetical protein